MIQLNWNNMLCGLEAFKKLRKNIQYPSIMSFLNLSVFPQMDGTAV